MSSENHNCHFHVCTRYNVKLMHFTHVHRSELFLNYQGNCFTRYKHLIHALTHTRTRTHTQGKPISVTHANSDIITFYSHLFFSHTISDVIISIALACSLPHSLTSSLTHAHLVSLSLSLLHTHTHTPFVQLPPTLLSCFLLQ